MRQWNTHTHTHTQQHTVYTEVPQYAERGATEVHGGATVVVRIGATQKTLGGWPEAHGPEPKKIMPVENWVAVCKLFSNEWLYSERSDDTNGTNPAVPT